MGTRDPREEARLVKEKLQQQDLARKELANKDRMAREDESKKKAALTPGRPEFNTNPARPKGFDTDPVIQEKFIKDQLELYNKFLQFINQQQNVNAGEKSQLQSEVSFDKKTGIITFSSVAAAAQFVAMKPNTHLEAKCSDRSDAVKAIRDMNGAGILKNLTKLSYMDNGAEQTLEGPELEAFKRKALPPRPTM